MKTIVEIIFNCIDCILMDSTTIKEDCQINMETKEPSSTAIDASEILYKNSYGNFIPFQNDEMVETMTEELCRNPLYRWYDVDKTKFYTSWRNNPNDIRD